MTVGVYSSRVEAEDAAKALKDQGLPAAVLANREVKLGGVVRTWEVIVPREQTAGPSGDREGSG